MLLMYQIYESKITLLEKMYTTNNLLLYSLSYRVFDRFAAVGCKHGTLSTSQSIKRYKNFHLQFIRRRHQVLVFALHFYNFICIL